MHGSHLTTLLEFLFTLCCCIFAVLRGGSAERLGALLIVASYVAAEIIFAVTWPHFPVFPTFVCDFALAIGLLIVSLRYGSIWLGFAMLLQSANLCSQALSFAGEGLSHSTGIILNNILSVLMAACIGMGTLFSWRKRRRLKTGAAQGAGQKAEARPAT